MSRVRQLYPNWPAEQQHREFLRRFLGDGTPVDVLERLAVPYLIVGSFASIAYGESRFTQDIDIVVALETKHDMRTVSSRFSLSTSASRSAAFPFR